VYIERPCRTIPPRISVSKESLAAFQEIVQHRNPRLFTEFLPRGYEMMTLSSVDPEFRSRLAAAKLHLGLLITLYDDLADSPKWANSKLLHELYKLPFHADSIRAFRLSTDEKKIVELAKHLADETFPILNSLPHFGSLGPLLHFDLQQFYMANRYCELLTRLPYLANTLEAGICINHNMGMVIIGMMDLMASSDLRFDELGEIRSLLLRGQRIGRICNVLTTLGRELSEGDVTNELVLGAIQNRLVLPKETKNLTPRKLASFRKTLEAERRGIFEEIAKNRDRIQTFEVKSYESGLRKLQRLHETMEGVI
jgi:hypothetical protein